MSIQDGIWMNADMPTFMRKRYDRKQAMTAFSVQPLGGWPIGKQAF